MAGVLFGLLFLLMFLSVPIAVALAFASTVAAIIFYPDYNMVHLVAQATVTAADSFPLMAIPFFMLVGTLMEKSGLAKKVIDVGEAIMGPAPGGLGNALIVACMIFAAISGSGPAVVAALGTTMIPSMVERGYSSAYAGSLTAAGATIGPVIPPSIPMIVFGVTSGVSTVAMFSGGIAPGILMGGGLIAVNMFISKKRGYLGKPRGGGLGWVMKQIWLSRWALALPIIILGGIYGGIFTPTEAAVIGAVYALFNGVFIEKTLTLSGIKDAFVEAGLLTCTGMFVVGSATTFGRLLTLERIPQQIAEMMLGITNSPVGIMLMIMGFLIVTGCFIDTISNVILFTPLFLPVVTSLGYHPVFFGVLMTMNLCVGMITPPVGVNLYVAQGISRASLDTLIKESIPLLATLFVVIGIVVLFPEIVLFLPRLLGTL